MTLIVKLYGDGSCDWPLNLFNIKIKCYIAKNYAKSCTKLT